MTWLIGSIGHVHSMWYDAIDRSEAALTTSRERVKRVASGAQLFVALVFICSKATFALPRLRSRRGANVKYVGCGRAAQDSHAPFVTYCCSFLVRSRRHLDIGSM